MTDVKLTPQQLIERVPQICGMLREHKLGSVADFVRQLGDALIHARYGLECRRHFE